MMKKRILACSMFYVFLTTVSAASEVFNGPASLLPNVYYYNGTYSDLVGYLNNSSTLTTPLSGLPTGIYTMPWFGNNIEALAYAKAWFDSNNWGGGLRLPRNVSIPIFGYDANYTPSFVYYYSGGSVDAADYYQNNNDPSDFGPSDSTVGDSGPFFYAVAVSN